MSDLDVFTADDLRQSAHYETLGPAYFSARRMAEQLMAGVEVEDLKQAATKAADDVRDKLYDYVETFLKSDLESNLQHHIDRTVQATVQALLTGEEWALRQYVLAQRHDAESVRAAVAKHTGESLLAMRVADLEQRVADLAQALRWERESRSRY